MHRFYVSQNIEGGFVKVTNPDQLHHLSRVLRLRVRDEVAVFDDKGNEYLCTIDSLGRQMAIFRVKEKREASTRATRITIGCAIPKKGGLDEIIDTLTQLGVDAIIPLETERVIVELDEARISARLERWRRIAVSAAEQSQRNTVPEVMPVLSFASLMETAGGYDVRLIPTLFGERKPLREALVGTDPKNVLALIGPEGDFSPTEVAAAVKAGFVPVTLGANVLRVATAAAVLVGYLTLSFVAR